MPLISGQFSENLQRTRRQEQQLDPAVDVQDCEMAIDLTYRFSFRTGALFIQPDLEYIL